jgi:protein CWC15
LPSIEGNWDDVPVVDSRDKDDAKLGKLASESKPSWAGSDSEDENSESDDGSDEGDEDSEDEDAALMRELEQIKRERAAEAAEKVTQHSAWLLLAPQLQILPFYVFRLCFLS